MCFPTFANRLAAQTPLSGSLSGTLAAGVYHATTSLAVDTGQTLTLQAGVIIKFTNGGQEFAINGTLQTNGTTQNPVIFTALADDSAGGDTNGNGASTGSPTAWRGVVFNSTSTNCVLNYADIRYGGAGFISNVHCNSASPTLSHCVLRNNYTHGINLNANSFPAVSNCTFTNNGGNAIDGVPIAALAVFANNTATGNGGNYARVTNASVSTNVAIAATAMLGGAITIDATILINSGAVLTFGPGVICKLMNGGVEVTTNGTLITNGTAANPVIFTGMADDSAGGDTNGNGASNGNPASWRGIVFNATSTNCGLHYTDIRYGGSGFISNVHCNSASPTLSHCVIRNNYTHGINLNSNSSPTITNCTFTSNSGNAIDGVQLAALPGLVNNTAAQNGGNFARVTSASVSTNLTIAATAMLGGAITVDTSILVNPGAVLTFGPGVICKLMNGGVEVTANGTLITNGTAANPVIFTGMADDSAGGDTNGNGASSGSPTSWRGVVFNTTSTNCVLNYADIRYGGAGFISNVHCNSASPTLSHCVIRNNYTHGMNLNSNSSPTVTNCTFTNNGGRAVAYVPFTAVPGFTNNAATGNAGNHLQVSSGLVSGVMRLGPQSILEGALMMTSTLTIPTGSSLTIEQGVNLKFDGGYEVNVDGRLNLLGTSYEPIVLTGAADDSIAGDTNNNGPGSAVPASWRGVVFNAGSLGYVENTLIRYAGSGFLPALTSASSGVTLRAVRADHAYSTGFELQALAGSAPNLIAWGCGTGIHLASDSFLVPHATVSGNTTGIRAETAWTGRVVNSIVYGNSTNFSNFGAGTQVLRSNGGFAGTNGNLNTDPLFENAAAGDFHLTVNSPCLAIADFVQALLTQKDFDENSRILDHALVGAPAPDMGAYERAAWDVAVSGQARPGSTLTFTLSGPPGASFIALGLVDGTAPFFPYGILLAGANPGSSVALLYPLTLPVGFPIPLPLVNDPALLSISAGIETLTFPLGNFAVGNFTRLYRMLIRP